MRLKNVVLCVFGTILIFSFQPSALAGCEGNSVWSHCSAQIITRKDRGLMDRLADMMQNEAGSSPQVTAIINTLRSQGAGSAGGFAAGRAVGAAMGSGTCTRHFRNETLMNVGIVMWNSGWCQVPGGASDTNICVIPPRQSAELRYLNNGAINAKVLISNGFMEFVYNLSPSGCHIEHSGSTGPQIVLNDPADGDIKTINLPTR